MAQSKLEELLKPCDVENFLANTWGKENKHIPGWRGKFSYLMPWSCLNEILCRHRIDYPRLRLTRDGKGLPASTYIRYTTGRRGKAAVPHILPVELNEQLRTGATLVLDAVDELFEPIRELATGLEQVFHEQIQVNAYAGWRTSRGFDLHWDDHDVFVLQITGRKRWSVYGMTTPYPMPEDRARNEKPAGDALWEDTLRDGDVLYIPRGWWHVAVPLDEPTLHLTVGIHNRTGTDLLRWIVQRTSAHLLFRQDLPRFASSAERGKHLSLMRTQLLREWDTGVLERFYSDMDGRAQPRVSFSLPWSATPDVFGLSPETRFRWTAPRAIEFRVLGGVVEFCCNGKRWRFVDTSLVILDALSKRSCSFAELFKQAEGVLREEIVRSLLSELVLHGLVAIENSRDDWRSRDE